jgi:2-amino-4-hydroxy-6-hydroxymethyldihydropteridine diphosphokinase
MTDNNIYHLGLSSNIGDRFKNLQVALEEISEFSTLQQVSPIYETEPYGIKDQGDFFNIALQINCELTPIELIVKLQEIEHRMGRIKTVKNGPRIIDIDILLNEGSVINEKNLKIPHPQMHKRNFVLKPLNDIASKVEHPLLKTSIEELLSKLTKPDKATLWTKKKLNI